MRRRVWLLGVLLSGFSNLTVTRAADMPDAGLLEFLGSVDTEDRDWRDYLARTDIDKVARRAGGTAGNPPAASTPPRDKPVDPPPANPPPPIAAKPAAPP